MNEHWHGRNTKMLWGLILLGIAYSSLLYFQGALTGTNKWDGIIGVVLGLYICSQSAAHVVDMFFFGRGAQRQFSSRQSTVLWLALNMLVLLVGWFAIFIGTTRLVSTGD